jgi:NAD(P)-dependent dehydrogenase (short-subunit alcohol dehydrogenase family)
MAERKAVLITGASSGIGAVTAHVLAERGFHVFAGVRRAEDGARIAAEIGERCTPVIIDVTDRAAIDSAADALAKAGGIFGLVNNAGIAVAGPLEYLPLETIRNQFEINLFGTLAVTQAMLPMLRRSVGRIVNVGSIGGRSPFPLMGPYAGSKAALDIMTTILRMELAPADIAVSYIEPGSHKTAIWERSGKAADTLERDLPPLALDHYGDALRGMRAIAARQERTGGDPRDVAHAIAAALTAAQPKARYTIGRDTKLRGILALLPARTRERLIASLLARASRA